MLIESNMNKIKTYKYLLIGLLSILLISSESISQRSKLNVLFIIADDLNCDIGAYGNSIIKTPNIDRLARNGVLFGNAHVQYPWCGPSRASFMTGLYPDQTKVKQLRINIREAIPEVVTIGQKFRQERYHSVRIGKIFHYHNPTHIGTSGNDDNYTWDQTVNPYGRDKLEEYKINTLKPQRYGGTLSWLAAEGSDEEQTDGIGANETIEFLDKFAKSRENFFLGFGLFRPHTPYVAPKSYYDLYDSKDIEIPEVSNDYLNSIPKIAAQSVRPPAKSEQHDLDKDLARTIKKAYYATTSFIDAQVGRVLDKLKETGLDKNTIIVFTSDHGYHLGEHGHWMKKTLFDNGTRIPLILSGPGINKNQKIMDAPIEMIDIYPTLMDLTGKKTPSFVSGRSFASLLNDSSKKVRESALSQVIIGNSGSSVEGYSIKTDRYRLTQWGENGIHGFELYDHNFDKQELNNLAHNEDYNNIRDSLKIVISNRITDARKKPDGITKQYIPKETGEPKPIYSYPKSKF